MQTCCQYVAYKTVLTKELGSPGATRAWAGGPSLLPLGAIVWQLPCHVICGTGWPVSSYCHTSSHDDGAQEPPALGMAWHAVLFLIFEERGSRCALLSIVILGCGWHWTGPEGQPAAWH